MNVRFVQLPDIPLLDEPPCSNEGMITDSIHVKGALLYWSSYSSIVALWVLMVVLGDSEE